jgi:hypothetical protein
LRIRPRVGVAHLVDLIVSHLMSTVVVPTVQLCRCLERLPTDLERRGSWVSACLDGTEALVGHWKLGLGFDVRVAGDVAGGRGFRKLVGVLPAYFGGFLGSGMVVVDDGAVDEGPKETKAVGVSCGQLGRDRMIERLTR